MEKILVIDDENDLCNLIADILKDAGYGVLIVNTEEEAYAQLKKHIVSLVLLDVCLTSGNQEGLNVLEYCRLNLPNLPVIMMSGHTSLDSAVEAVKQGAMDFLEKPFSRQRLLTSVEREISSAESKRILARLQRFDYDINLVAQSAPMLEVMQKISKNMKTASRMCILGGKGSGKNSLAYYIHSHTANKTSRYYEVDCSSISNKQELLKLLVGVSNANNGLLFHAVEGTLVIDKLDHANDEVQQTLLEILKQLESRKVNFKIIALADTSLNEKMERGEFKTELLTQFKDLQVILPSLKERQDDILPLIQKFSLPYNPEVPEDVLQILQGHAWPGNLHELKNVVQQMLLKNPNALESQHLVWKVCDLEDPNMLLLQYREAVQMFTQKYFEAQLNMAEGNQTQAAKNAGVDRSTFYRRTGVNPVGKKDKNG